MNNTFLSDEEKMRDFYELTKEEFLASYSYLTEEEYDATREAVKEVRGTDGFKNEYDKTYNYMLECRENFIDQLKNGIKRGESDQWITEQASLIDGYTIAINHIGLITQKKPMKLINLDKIKEEVD